MGLLPFIEGSPWSLAGGELSRQSRGDGAEKVLPKIAVTKLGGRKPGQD